MEFLDNREYPSRFSCPGRHSAAERWLNVEGDLDDFIFYDNVYDDDESDFDDYSRYHSRK